MIAPVASHHSMPAIPAVISRVAKVHSLSAVLSPPPGFNPLTAPAQELALYGYPPRPTNSSALALWENAMRRAITPEAVPTATHVAGLTQPLGAVGQDRTSWAGYEADSSYNAGSQFTDALAQFTVPSVPANGGYTSYSVSDPMDAYWVGLGGTSAAGGALWQAALLAVSESSPYYTFAYQYTVSTDTLPQRITTVPISAGQTAYIEVWLNSVGDYGHYWVENLSTGKYATDSANPTHITNTQITSSFECVAEWPQLAGSAYLPNYGSMTIDACEAATNYTSNFQVVNSYNYIQDGDWCSNFKDRVQYPDALQGGGDFVVNYQPYNNCQ